MSSWKQIKDNPKTKENFIARAEIIHHLRDFFWQKDFLEIDTPVASPFAGQEPYLDPMSLDFVDPCGKKIKHYLQTSPEYAMKKLLAGGFEKIFQVCHCFRNNESFGGQHYPEFLMLEWYRVGVNYFKIMDDTEGLIKFIAQKMNREYFLLNDKKIIINAEWARVSMRGVWKEYIGVDLNNYLSLPTMTELAKDRGFTVEDNDLYEDVFYKIFLNEIEPQLGFDTPVFIYEYPACMAALSQICKHDERYAERFELYVGGVELANAFGELLDGEGQKKRFVEEQKLRAELGKEVYLVDEDLINALEFLKNKKIIASGIALGVDRLIMLLFGILDIREIRLDAIE